MQLRNLYKYIKFDTFGKTLIHLYKEDKSFRDVYTQM